MLTKTQTIIMKVFVSKINNRFSIKQISDTIKKPYPLVHRSIKSLIEERFVVRDDKELLSLNYKENHSELAYIESIRKRELFKDKIISLFVKDAIEKIKSDFFIFLIFGSAVESKNSRDIDILFITENKGSINEIEKILKNIAVNFTKKFDINVIPAESVYEMLAKRDDANLINETLNKHIILFGAENYYKMLKNAR